MNPSIELKSVSKSFEGQILIPETQLQIARGEKFVLIGPSGFGKSVLLKLMCGILKPSSGKVFIDGLSLWDSKESERLETIKKVGMLFQKNALFDSLTVSENVAFPMREVTKLNEKEITDRIEYFLNEVGIYHAKDLFPDEISGGMQKRLGIARALALYPQIIFYDDPTAGLDPITSRKIIDLILKLQSDLNSTLVAITNDMNRAFQMADRLAIVLEKEFFITGNKNQTQNHKDLRVQQFIHGKLHGPLTDEQHTPPSSHQGGH